MVTSLVQGPFDISAARIAHLSEDDLVRLMNHLLWAEASHLGMQADHVRTSLRFNDPDGGIDALIGAAPSSSMFFSPEEVVWQFKKTWPQPAGIRRDLTTGAGAREAFARGAGYAFVIGQDKVPQTQRRFQKSLEEVATEFGCTGGIRLYCAEQVARWATSVLSAVLELQPVVANYTRADRVLLGEARHRIPYETDPARQAIMDDLKDSLLSWDGSLTKARIQGEPGVGKTRLALEAVKNAGVDGLTLYAATPPTDQSLFAAVASQHQTHAILIVDECEDAEAIRLEAAAAQCEGRLKLITVGPGVTTGINMFPLEPLDEDAMRRVVKGAAPGLLPEDVRWVVRRTGGFVKLAVVVAQALGRGVTTTAQMATDSEVQRAVIGMVSRSEDERAALKGASLLTRMGCANEAKAEGQAIANFMGIEWNGMHRLLLPAIDQGLVVRKGDYVYVTPQLLAEWLSAEVWRHWGHRIEDLHDSLPSEASRDSFLRRLSQLGGLPSVKDVLERLVGPSGHFRELDSLDSQRPSRLFLVLSEGVPEEALRTLERLFEGKTRTDLLSFTNGRRNVIWTIERLLESRATFFGAARILRRLAEAETESVSNNASGVWSSMFLTRLAPTEVPADERLVLLEEAFVGSSESKLLAIDAISSALQGHETGLALRDSGSSPAHYWRPRTWDEIWDYKRAALRLLGAAVSDVDSATSARARKAFLENARSLAAAGLGNEVVEWCQRLRNEGAKEQRDLWETCTELLAYESDHLEELQRGELVAVAESIYGSSIVDRIKRFTGRWSPVDWPREADREEMRPEAIAGRLAEEVMRDGIDISPVLPWLVSGEAEGVWPFALRLGVEDTARKWLDPIVDATRLGSDFRLLSGYLRGRFDQGDTEWREELLDGWSEEEEMASAAFDATIRGPSGDAAAQRILKLVDKGWIEPERLAYLRYGRWVASVTEDRFLEILDRLRDPRNGSYETQLNLLFDWLPVDPNEIDPRAREAAWEVLGRSKAEGGTMSAFFWRSIADKLVDLDPDRMVSLVIETILAGGMTIRDERLKLLEKAMQSGGGAQKLLDEVLSALQGPQGYMLEFRLDDVPLLDWIPSEEFIEWVESRGATAADMIAGVVDVPDGPLPEAVRFLIANYPSEVTSQLRASFLSGSWWGSTVDHLARKLVVVEGWEADVDPVIRSWARGLADSIRENIRAERAREEHEDLP